MTKLHQKIAIVTGASRKTGIGTAVCRAFAKEGADVFFTYWTAYDDEMPYVREEDNSWHQKLEEDIRSYGVRCASMSVDLAQPDATEQLLNQVEQTLGSPTILVNNATHSVDVDFRSLDAAVLDAHYAVNVRGTLLLTAAFAKRIEGAQSGRVINLVSGQDKQPQPGNLAYVSTKGAVSAFTKSVALELAPLCITVNAVDPGPTDTGWMTEELKTELQPRFPMGRIGVPNDAAKIIVFLAGEESEWVTGQIIHSDGGFW